MIWAILAFLGVPLWVCAAGISILVFRNRSLRRREGNISVRIQRAGATRWTRGNAVWVHDALAFRGSPAAWTERLEWVSEVSLEEASAADLHKLRHLEDPVVAVFTTVEGDRFKVAAPGSVERAVLGPFATSGAGGGARP